ncbi:hypothetical protein BN159_8254 [Streptomyces davaonensis JCM 4913]|uniref:DUF6777 domain-containing protein n=1 Tax=Streptomyces davaonensis (strain DSM 101723 / JCM 4913 / KCC S-0913 / 768) TaxID=1214101 RepID=K4RG02_STRDJ|nr:DUF6777 domain-containing protein [Streptomyces davaonensis]CCK32632.1 hypothetical protein BN159_8254 [Streptomyces davaonensis JCM 4913]
MSVEPPSSGRPTGPPSGPLSGPSQPPAGPPSGSGGVPSSQPPSSGGGVPPGPPTGGSGGGGVPPEPEPHRPWWRSVPRIAVVATAVVAAVVIALVFSRGDGGSGSGGEVFLQAAGKSGPDPFTESTATDSSAPPVTPTPAATDSANAVQGVDGGAPGLYGGTRNVASCDVEKQIKALQAAPAKNKAFASVAGVDPSGVPAYLRDLTPVQLRMDTRVTNHGYRDGSATSYQAVLQSGTAVLVDDRGEPRVRCACGNPLTPPVAQQSTPKPTGDSWPSYSSSNVVVVQPATVVINVFVVYDPEHDDWFHRHPGDTGGKDQKTDPPAHQPKPSTITPPSTSPGTTTACPSPPTGTPTGEATDCPTSPSAPTSPSEPTTPSEPTSPPTSEPPSEPETAGTSSPEVPLASTTTATASTSLATSGSPSLSPAV